MGGAGGPRRGVGPSPCWAPARLRACWRAAAAAARAARRPSEAAPALAGLAPSAWTSRCALKAWASRRALKGVTRARLMGFPARARAVCGEGPEAGGAGAEGAAEVLAGDQQPEGGALPGRAGGDPGDDAGAPRAHAARLGLGSVTNSQQEVLFLGELEEMLEMTQARPRPRREVRVRVGDYQPVGGAPGRAGGDPGDNAGVLALAPRARRLAAPVCRGPRPCGV